MRPKINIRITIIAHPGAKTIILVGEDGTTLAFTPEVARTLAEQLPSMAAWAEVPPVPEDVHLPNLIGRNN